MQSEQQQWLLSEYLRILTEFRDAGVKVYTIVGNGDVSANYSIHEEFESRGLCVLVNMKRVPITPDHDLAGYPYVPFSYSSMKDFEKFDCTTPPPGLERG